MFRHGLCLGDTPKVHPALGVAAAAAAPADKATDKEKDADKNKDKNKDQEASAEKVIKPELSQFALSEEQRMEVHFKFSDSQEIFILS